MYMPKTNMNFIFQCTMKIITPNLNCSYNIEAELLTL